MELLEQNPVVRFLLRGIALVQVSNVHKPFGLLHEPNEGRGGIAQTGGHMEEGWRRLGHNTTAHCARATDPLHNRKQGSCSELLCTEAHHHQAAFLDSDWPVMDFTAAHAIQRLISSCVGRGPLF